MKIVVSAAGQGLEAQVDPRFGRAAGFVLFDTQTREVRNDGLQAFRADSTGPCGDTFYDYSPEPAARPGLVVRALEALERSDYRRFRRSVAGELRESFAQVEVLSGAAGSAWYLCRP